MLRRPFFPFRMHLADGRVIAVPHPERMLISANNRTTIVDGQPFDHRIDIMLITGIEFDAEPSTDPWLAFEDPPSGERAA